MFSSIDVEIRPNSQSVPSDVFLIFSEQDREIGEKIHESLMREGLKIEEQPVGVGVSDPVGREAIAGSIEKAGTIVYLVSAHFWQSALCQQELALALADNKRIIPLMVEILPGEDGFAPTILPAIDFSHYGKEEQYRSGIEQLVKEIRERGMGVAARKSAIAQPPATSVTPQKKGNRQLVIWRSLFAAATIGLVAMIGVNGTLYQKYLSANQNEQIVLSQKNEALQQRERAIADRQQMNDRLSAANTKTAAALKAEQQAKTNANLAQAEAQQANTKAALALQGEQQAKLEGKLLNDRLSAANLKAGKALQGEQQAKASADKAKADFKAANTKLTETLRREQQLKTEVETAKIDLNQAKHRSDIAEERVKLAEANTKVIESQLQQCRRGRGPQRIP